VNYTINELDAEFERVLLNTGDFRTLQRTFVDYYNKNVFYTPLPGEPKPKRNVGVNLLKAFADKNIHYLSPFPTIKKLPSGDMEARTRASLIEKILHSTYRYNKGKMMQRKLAVDGTLMAEMYVMAEFGLKTRCVHHRRLDPRYSYPVFSNAIDNKLKAFYYAVPMTKEAIISTYGVDPEKSGIGSTTASLDGNEIPVDGDSRFYVVMRWDDQVRCVWVGNKFLEKPHNHQMGFIPVANAYPFENGMTDNRGGFFLDALAPIQAEFNETLRRKANIIRKLSNPAVWGRGIIASQFDDIKKALNGDAGFIGLKQQGELGFLQLAETKLLDDHMADLLARMKDISGFPTATFGESVGANTSGDALSMYFQPTTQATANQWIAISNLYESLNEMTLKLYEIFGRTGEEFKITGSRPKGTYEPTMQYDDAGEEAGYKNTYQTGGYSATFTADQIAGDYETVVMAPTAQPSDTYKEKQLAQSAVSTGFLPRIQAYEDYGIIDPEDTVNQLAEEREDPRLHPEVFSAAAGAMNQGQPPVPAGA
jgi:hypothetical protein